MSKKKKRWYHSLASAPIHTEPTGQLTHCMQKALLPNLKHHESTTVNRTVDNSWKPWRCGCCFGHTFKLHRKFDARPPLWWCQSLCYHKAGGLVYGWGPKSENRQNNQWYLMSEPLVSVKHLVINSAWSMILVSRVAPWPETQVCARWPVFENSISSWIVE